ncbi:hypothetical protein [Streptomyces sp. NPDC048386]|uniref:hypothetical protein n=1 Tax=Streptomyces sp. NPDC048386 TaxID=3365541 RepID=UPI00371B1EE8
MAVPYETAYGPLTAVADWLRANGIDPADVPIDASIGIERLTYAGARCIRYTALLRSEEGRPYVDPATGRAAEEERIELLTVDPPENVQVRDASE